MPSEEEMIKKCTEKINALFDQRIPKIDEYAQEIEKSQKET